MRDALNAGNGDSELAELCRLGCRRAGRTFDERVEVGELERERGDLRELRLRHGEIEVGHLRLPFFFAFTGFVFVTCFVTARAIAFASLSGIAGVGSGSLMP